MQMVRSVVDGDKTLFGEFGEVVVVNHFGATNLVPLFVFGVLHVDHDKGIRFAVGILFDQISAGYEQLDRLLQHWRQCCLLLLLRHEQSHGHANDY